MTQAPQQLSLNVQLRDDARFANFFVGENTLVCNLLQQAAKGEGELLLYLWGAAGSGCSHLLQATCHLSEEYGLSAAYLPFQELGDMPPAMLEGFEAFDLICMDNIEAVAGRSDWEEALFHLFNRIRQSEKHLIVAAKAPPRQLPLTLADLHSRLSWGLVLHLLELQDDEKIQALILRARQRGFELQEDAARYLLHHTSRNMSALYAILEQLDSASLSAKRRVTVPFIKQALGW